jgi:DtxR family Mn-dependent transcriptional regulator
MSKDNQISANMEDYLEAIAVLKKDVGVARVKDIGRLLNVKNPSVNSALNLLSNAGLVKHERYGYADLTQEGEAAAYDVMARHGAMVRFLTVILDVDHQTAEEDACRMEHSMSKEVFDKLTKFMDFVETCREDERPEWLKRFYFYMKTGIKTPCSVKGTQKDEK